jgi:hypothetical protein
METTFYINLNIKTANGFQPYARYFIGDDREAAAQIFHQLKGTNEVTEDHLLQIDFIESANNLPVNLQVIGCNLEQLAENSKIITREIFKLLNLC